MYHNIAQIFFYASFLLNVHQRMLVERLGIQCLCQQIRVLKLVFFFVCTSYVTCDFPAPMALELHYARHQSEGQPVSWLLGNHP